MNMQQQIHTRLRGAEEGCALSNQWIRDEAVARFEGTGRGEKHELSERLRQVGGEAALNGAPESKPLDAGLGGSGCAAEPRTRQLV